MTLADKLKKLRILHKMSMSEVARLSGIASDHRGKITQGYISRLESGKETNPSLMKLLTLCGIYKVEPNELFLNNLRKKSRKR
jgi:transcriptional regulator with XRE-family HTH domain